MQFFMKFTAWILCFGHAVVDAQSNICYMNNWIIDDAKSGLLHSPRYPNGYPNSHCSVTLTSQTAITLKIHDFYLFHNRNYDKICYDYLEYQEKNESTFLWCGFLEEVPHVYNSKTNNVTITFRSQWRYKPYRGFNLSFESAALLPTMLPSPTRITQSTTTVASTVSTHIASTVDMNLTVRLADTTVSPSASSTPVPQRSSSGPTMNTDNLGSAIGGALGGIVLLIILILLLIFILKRQSRKHLEKYAGNDTELTSPHSSAKQQHQDIDDDVINRISRDNLDRTHRSLNTEELYAKPQKKKQQLQPNEQIQVLYAKPQKNQRENQAEQTTSQVDRDSDYDYANFGDECAISIVNEDIVDGDNIHAVCRTENEDEVEMIENDVYSAGIDLCHNSDEVEMIDNDIYSEY